MSPLHLLYAEQIGLLIFRTNWSKMSIIYRKGNSLMDFNLNDSSYVILKKIIFSIFIKTANIFLLTGIMIFIEYDWQFSWLFWFISLYVISSVFFASYIIGTKVTESYTKKKPITTGFLIIYKVLIYKKRKETH